MSSNLGKPNAQGSYANSVEGSGRFTNPTQEAAPPFENAPEGSSMRPTNPAQALPPLPEQNPGTTMQQAANNQEFKANCAPQPQPEGYRSDGGNNYNQATYPPRNYPMPEYSQERYAQNPPYVQNQYYGPEQSRPQQNPYNSQPSYNERGLQQYQFQPNNQAQYLQQKFYQQDQRQQTFQPDSQYRTGPGSNMCPPRLPSCPPRPQQCPPRPQQCPPRPQQCPPRPQQCPPPRPQQCPPRPQQCPPRPPVCPQPQNPCSQSPPPCRSKPKKCSRPKPKQCPPQQPPCQLQYFSNVQENSCEVPEEPLCPKPKCKRRSSCKPRKSSCSRTRRLPNCATEQDQYYYDDPSFQQQQLGSNRVLEFDSRNWAVQPPPQRNGLGQGQQQPFYGTALEPQQPFFQQPSSGWTNTGQEVQLRPQQLFPRNMVNPTGQAEQIYYSPMTLSLFVNENHNKKITQPCQKKDQCQKPCPPKRKKKGPCFPVARKPVCTSGRLCSRNHSSCERPSPRSACRSRVYPTYPETPSGYGNNYSYYDTDDEQSAGYDQRYFRDYAPQQDLSFFQNPTDYNLTRNYPCYNNYSTNQGNYTNQNPQARPQITELLPLEPCQNPNTMNENKPVAASQDLKEKNPTQDACGCYGCPCDDPVPDVQVLHPPPGRKSIKDELTLEDLKRSDPYTRKGQPEVGTNPELTPTGLTPTSLTPTSLTPTSVTPTGVTPTRTTQELKKLDSEVPFDEDIELLPPIVLRDSSQDLTQDDLDHYHPYIYPIPIPLDQLPEDDTPVFTFSELAQNYIPDSRNDVVPQLIIEYFTINPKDISESARRSFGESHGRSHPDPNSPQGNTNNTQNGGSEINAQKSGGTNLPQGSSLSPGRSAMGAGGSHLGPQQSVMGVGGSHMGPQQSVMGIGGSHMGPQQSVMGVGGSHMGPQKPVMGVGGSHMGPQQSVMGVGGSHLGPQKSVMGVGGSHMGPQQSIMGIGGAKSPNASGGQVNPGQPVMGKKVHGLPRNIEPAQSVTGIVRPNHNLHPSIARKSQLPKGPLLPGLSIQPQVSQPRRRQEESLMQQESSRQQQESLMKQDSFKQQGSKQQQESLMKQESFKQNDARLQPQESLQQQGSLQKPGSLQQHSTLNREESLRDQSSRHRDNNQFQNDEEKRGYNDRNDERRNRRYSDESDYETHDRRYSSDDIRFADEIHDRRYNENRDPRYNDYQRNERRDPRCDDQNGQSHLPHHERRQHYPNTSHIPGVDDSGSQVTLAMGSSGGYRCKDRCEVQCPIPVKASCMKRRQCGVRTQAQQFGCGGGGGGSKRVEPGACPMMVVGQGLQIVPSITRFDQRRELNIPGMKLFDLDRKCGQIPESCRYKPAPPREPLCNRPGFQRRPRPVCNPPPPTICEQKKQSPYCHVPDEAQQCNIGAAQRCGQNTNTRDACNGNTQTIQRHRQTSPTKFTVRRVRDIGCSTTDICQSDDDNYYQPSASTENCSPSKQRQRPPPPRNRVCPPKKPTPPAEKNPNCITKCPSHCVKKPRKSSDKGTRHPHRRRKSGDKGGHQRRKSSERGGPVDDEQYNDFPSNTDDEYGDGNQDEEEEVYEDEHETEEEPEPQPDHSNLFNVPSPLPITPSAPFPSVPPMNPSIQMPPFEFELKPSVTLTPSAVHVPPLEIPKPKPGESKTAVVPPSPSKANVPTPSKTLIPKPSKPIVPTESKSNVPKRSPLYRFKQLPPEVASKCRFPITDCGKPGYCRPQLPDCDQPWSNKQYESAGTSCLSRVPFSSRPARRQQTCRPRPPPCPPPPCPPPQPICRPPQQLCRMSPPPFRKRSRCSKKTKCIELQQVMIQGLEQKLEIIQEMWRNQQPLMPANCVPTSLDQNAAQQPQQNLQQGTNQDMIRDANNQKQMTEQAIIQEQMERQRQLQQQAQWAQQQQQIQQPMQQQQPPMGPQMMQNNPMFQQDMRNNMMFQGGQQLSLTEQERQWRMQVEDEMRQRQQQSAQVQWRPPGLDRPQMGSIDNLAQQCRMLQDMQSQRGPRLDDWAPHVQQYGSMGFGVGEQQMGTQRGQPYDPIVTDSQMRLQQGQQFGPMASGMQMQFQQGQQFGGVPLVGPQMSMQQPQQFRPMSPGSQIIQGQQTQQFGPLPTGSQMQLQQQQRYGQMPMQLQMQPQQGQQFGPMSLGEQQMRMQQPQQYGAQNPAEQQFRIQQNQQWSPQPQGQGQPMLQSPQPQGIGISPPSQQQQSPLSSQLGTQQQSQPQPWNPPSQQPATGGQPQQWNPPSQQPVSGGQPGAPTAKECLPPAMQNNLAKTQQQCSPNNLNSMNAMGKSCPPQIPMALALFIQEDPNAKCKPAKASCPAPICKVVPFPTNKSQCNTKCRPTTPKQIRGPQRSRCNNLP